MFEAFRDWFRRRGPYWKHNVQAVEFLAEQNGEIELTLKSVWCAMLQSQQDVLRAYLARVNLKGAEAGAVALVLVTTKGPNAALAAELARPVRERMARTVFLDMLFVDEKGEAPVAAVCRPFFERFVAN